VSKLLFKVAVPYGGGSARSGIGVKLLNAVKKCRNKKFSFLPLYSFASRTKEYHRHRSIHHPISLKYAIRGKLPESRIFIVCFLVLQPVNTIV